MPSDQAAPPRRSSCRGCLAALVTACQLTLYTLLVTYDVRVWTILPSLWHYVRLPIDPDLDRWLPTPAPDDPAAIEAYVRQLLPWASDAEVYGLPWYFPTPREAVAARRGDCEAQTVVTASLFAARGLPFVVRASFSHLWLDYPGRPEREGERHAEAMIENVGGRYRFRWPAAPELREHLRTQKSLLWDPLHPVRKILLLVGWPVIGIGWPWYRRRLEIHRG